MEKIKKIWTDWQTCIICAIFLSYTIIQNYLFGTFHTELIRELAVSPFVYGNISSVYWYSLAFALLPVGILCDRFPAKRLLFFATFISLTASLLLFSTSSVYVCAINRALCGVANAFAFIGGLRAIKDDNNKLPALAIGVFLAIGNLGGVVASGPYLFLKEAYSWKMVVFINFLIGSGLVLIMMLFLYRTDKAVNYVTSRWSFVEELKKIIFGVKLTCTNLNVWICGLYIGILSLPDCVFAPLWGVVYLSQKYNMPESHAGIVISSLVLGLGIGAPLTGWLGDFWEDTKSFMLIASVFCAAIFLYIIYSPIMSITRLSVLFGVLGIISTASVLAFANIQKNAPKELLGFSIALTAMIMNLFTSFSQPFFGWLLEKQWDGALVDGAPSYSVRSLDDTLLFIPIAFAVSSILVLLIKKTKPEKAKVAYDEI